MRRGPFPVPVEERFWEYVDRSGDCWLWTGHKDKKGYGRIGVSGAGQRLAHRISFLMEYGAEPKGLLLCHSCDTPACVNPEHLWVGTIADNQEDMARKGRAGNKLTLETAALIRSRLEAGEQGRVLAKEFGIDDTSVSRIKLGKSWRFAVLERKAG